MKLTRPDKKYYFSGSTFYLQNYLVYDNEGFKEFKSFKELSQYVEEHKEQINSVVAHYKGVDRFTLNITSQFRTIY